MVQEHAGSQETGRQPEILDSERLRNHGALYGRFLLASLPRANHLVNTIINPTFKEYFELTEASLKGRNYNPVCERSSIAERKKQWEGSNFSDAYSQWRTEFTGFMKEIKDPQRIRALQIIASDQKKPENFTEGDAEQLFNDFCKDGRSNITGFIERVTTSLKGTGRIDPANLQALLPHLEWIASGLFGKETASNVVTRLIELESEIRNNPGAVVRLFNENKARINDPTQDEKMLLGFLHKGGIPSLTTQEKGVPRVTTVPVPIVSTGGGSPKPAPVPGSGEGEGKDKQLGVSPPPPPAQQIPEQKNGEDTEDTGTLVSSNAEAASITENITNFEGKTDPMKEFNEILLTLDPSVSHTTAIFSPDFFLRHIISVSKEITTASEETKKEQLAGVLKL